MINLRTKIPVNVSEIAKLLNFSPANINTILQYDADRGDSGQPVHLIRVYPVCINSLWTWRYRYLYKYTEDS